ARRKTAPASGPPARPIRTAVLRGLAVVLPPLLTIVIFIWVAGTIRQYVLEPVRVLARDTVVWAIADIRTNEQLPDEERENQKAAEANSELAGRLQYTKVANGGKKGKGTYIPRSVYQEVEHDESGEPKPRTAKEIYRRYVELKYLQPYQMIPYFLCGFILVLYLLGKFMAAGAGRFFWGTFEHGITRVPLVRNVYSSVKQVSDFILSEREVQYSRVVAVEWPRKGIWCLALVTGSSLKEVQTAAGEDVLSVLIPTSPMPMTGFTVIVKKSETIDLDITMDQAIQFIVSCGVVAPSSQIEKMKVSPGRRAELIAASDSSQSGSKSA
ncbi:MAG: hypothetical protein A2V98_12815, partial [Planctomycetes bacterium RBG_16_64_12]